MLQTNMGAGVVLVLCIWTLIVGVLHAQSYDSGCYNSSQNPYLLFGSKTAYEQVYGQKNEPVRDCHPAQIWMVIRHGTRYPDREDIFEMQNLQSLRDQIVRNRETEHRGQLCGADIQNFKTWYLQVAPNQADALTKQGRDDMNFMAQRFKRRYPELLQQPYSSDIFIFRHTKEDRTRESAGIFTDSLFGNRGGVNFLQPPDNDTFLRPNKFCPGWERDVLRTNETDRELNLFLEGPEVKNLIRDVSERLGFRYELTFSQIKLMYDMCRYNKAWRREAVSAWCAAFTTQELMVLEYAEDLKYYYRYGYGNENNKRLACPLVRDLVQNFRKLEDENNSAGRKPVGIFYFTHESALTLLLTALDIARDHVPLRHDNYKEMQKRQWRMSYNGPFAGNLAAVFYKCNGNGNERYQMTFMSSERLVSSYENCRVGLCSWDYIKDKFAKTVAECNSDFCLKGFSSGERLNQQFVTVFITALLLIMYHRST